MCWLQHAALCRANGHAEGAARAILEALAARAPNAHLEQARLHWDSGQPHRAVMQLQQACERLCSVCTVVSFWQSPASTGSSCNVSRLCAVTAYVQAYR